jgi:hypothetical protein
LYLSRRSKATGSQFTNHHEYGCDLWTDALGHVECVQKGYVFIQEQRNVQGLQQLFQPLICAVVYCYPLTFTVPVFQTPVTKHTSGIAVPNVKMKNITFDSENRKYW